MRRWETQRMLLSARMQRKWQYTPHEFASNDMPVTKNSMAF